ncbi:MAG: HTTM domain-containing protein [Candidatus Obscuribacterales bacterium]|nr:HTTM domain-containing protein [Candidatus Obscuribacterales bacterium]
MRISLSKITDSFDRLVLQPQSALPIAIFRILLAICTLLGTSSPDFMTWFSVEGWPQHFISKDIFVIDLFRVLPQTAESSRLLYSILMGSALCLGLGLFTRLSSFLVWLSLVSLTNHYPYGCGGQDALREICAFFLIFSPAGKRLSLDNWLCKKFKKGGENLEAEFSPYAQRLIQLQIASIYWQAFWIKLPGHTWIDGSAIYYLFHIKELCYQSPPFLREELWFSQLLSWGALAVELALWALVWFKKLRYPILLSGVLLHLGIEFTSNIPFFGLTMISSYVLFIDSKDLEAILLKLKSLFAKKTDASSVSVP